MSKRAEARRKNREKSSTAVYNFTMDQLDAYVKEEVTKLTEVVLKDATVTISELFMVYCYNALHSQFKFGKSRLADFKEAIDDIADRVANDELSNEELIIHCHSKLGVDMTPLFAKFGIEIEGFDKTTKK